MSRLRVLVMAAGLLAATVPAQPVGEKPGPVASWREELRGTLKRQFPWLYATSMAAFGWHRPGADESGGQDAGSAPRTVVLVHGLDEPGRLWMNLAPALAADGHCVRELRYPNDQPIRRSATFFLQALLELHEMGAREIVIVAHSMGGLVSRELLTSPALDYQHWVQRGAVPRVRGLIMVGTPNHGSALAHLRVFSELREQSVRAVQGNAHVLSWFADGCGEAGWDLLPDSPFLRELNARPQPRAVAMTVIAGTASPWDDADVEEAWRQWQRVLPDVVAPAAADLRRELGRLTDGIGDGAVPVESTRLEGVSDWVSVKGNHLSMIRNLTLASDRVPPAVPVIRDRIERLWPRVKQNE